MADPIFDITGLTGTAGLEALETGAHSLSLEGLTIANPRAATEPGSVSPIRPSVNGRAPLLSYSEWRTAILDSLNNPRSNDTEGLPGSDAGAGGAAEDAQ